eukprot:scaffold1282_cov251-Pinguiococcus_pyrenoidosus.AAC.32
MAVTAPMWRKRSEGHTLGVSPSWTQPSEQAAERLVPDGEEDRGSSSSGGVQRRQRPSFGKGASHGEETARLWEGCATIDMPHPPHENVDSRGRARRILCQRAAEDLREREPEGARRNAFFGTAWVHAYKISQRFSFCRLSWALERAMRPSYLYQPPSSEALRT